MERERSDRRHGRFRDEGSRRTLTRGPQMRPVASQRLDPQRQRARNRWRTSSVIRARRAYELRRSHVADETGQCERGSERDAAAPGTVLLGARLERTLARRQGDAAALAQSGLQGRLLGSSRLAAAAACTDAHPARLTRQPAQADGRSIRQNRQGQEQHEQERPELHEHTGSSTTVSNKISTTPDQRCTYQGAAPQPGQRASKSSRTLRRAAAPAAYSGSERTSWSSAGSRPRS